MLGEIYVNLGQPEKASAVLEEALRHADRLAPLERAEALQMLAQAAEARQRFAETERWYGEAVALLRTLDAPLSLSEALAGLGLAWSRNDRNEDADRVLQEAIALQREHAGPDSKDGLRFQVYRAEALFNADRRDEARALMDAAIGKLRARLPPDDLDLIASLGFYAVLLRDLGESAAAEAVFLEILAQRRTLLARDSQRIALVHNNLGRVYYDQGRTLDATAQYQAAYDLGARQGSDQDPSHAIDQLNLASLYEEVGDYARAEPLMRGGVAILEAHPDAVGFLLPLGRQNLGRLLLLAGKADEARHWLEKPIEARPDKDWAMERGRQRLHLADWHRRYGDLAQARRWIAEAEANLQDIGGPESPRVSAIERVRGQIAARAGDFEAARRDLESAAARLAKARSETYVGVGELALELADLAQRAGDPARARRELERAERILDPLLSSGAPARTRMKALRREVGVE